MLLSFYGDDFTGSTDVMEALTRSGVETILFVEPPAPDQLQRYPDAEAVGVAGLSRSMTPAEMDERLPAAFEAMRRLGAPLVHYKVCSTFDSSPQVGSIGRAIDLGQRALGGRFVPLVVGAPILGRYCVFGNLFARSGLDTEPYRLDRHPTMRRHPVTPMEEADLTLHLSRQTDKRIGLLDVLKLGAGDEQADRALEELLASGSRIVLFDTLHESDLRRIGRLIWRRAEATPPLFAVGSSGLEYALAAHWRAEGAAGPAPEAMHGEPVDRLLVVSGSCAPVTDRQIAHALDGGFAEVAMDTRRLVAPHGRDATIQSIVEEAAVQLRAGRSVIVHTSRGPDDHRIEATRSARAGSGGGGATAVATGPPETESMARILGVALGDVLRLTLERVPLRRAAVTGGDTSGYVARRLGIEALEMIGPLAPGSPLCRAHAEAGPINGLQITFKGGQVGRADFFDSVLRGQP